MTTLLLLWFTAALVLTLSFALAAHNDTEL
jgi:hypothetical protein